MRRLLSLTCLIATVVAATYFRLNTNENTRLNVGDALISTMGLFKATLLQSRCTLSIETFNGNNAYDKVGNYTSGNYSGNCNFLNITKGKVVTDNNFTYMEAGTNDYLISTILTLDDLGVIRLIGTYYPPENSNEGVQLSDEVTITTFQTTRTHIYSVSQLAVNFLSTLGPINNQRNWTYEIGTGQLDIYNYNDPGLGVHYSYSQFIINNSYIGDFNRAPFPGAIFPNITYQPRCL